MGIRSDLLLVTRRSITEAAMHLFVERGVAATKMEDILSNSGISVGSFYYLFKNKVDLAVNLYVETQQQLFEVLSDELSKHTEASAKEGLAALIQTYWQWALNHPEEMYYIIFCRESEVTNDDRKKASEAEFNNTVIHWLNRFIEQGEIKPLNPQQFLALLFGPVDYLIRGVLDNYSTKNGPAVLQLIDTSLNYTEPIIEAIWQGLRRVEVSSIAR